MSKQKQIDYAGLFTKRKDGRYVASYTNDTGRHYLYDKDPEALYHRLEAEKSGVKAEKPPTFREIAEAWEAKHWERIGYKTREAYTAPLRRLLDKYGDMDANGVSAQMVYAYLSELGRKGYSRRSVQMHRDIVSMIYNDGIVSGTVNTNPCSAISLPRNLPSTKRELPEDDAIQAVRTKTDHPFALFALICLYSGLRRGEVLALNHSDIDRKNKLIHVTKSIEYIGNDPRVKSPKTESGVRDVIILDALMEHLPKNGKGLLFPRPDNGEPLTKTQYRKRWESYCSYIGFDLTAHQLRHGFATILYEAGIPDKDAQELMGHSSIALTRDVYTHIRQSRRGDTANALNEFLTTK